MAWSPPARQRRSWLVEQAGDYVTQISYQTRDGTWNNPAMKLACARMSRPPMFRTCPFLIIAIAS
jgi:hypothetical protein